MEKTKQQRRRIFQRHMAVGFCFDRHRPDPFLRRVVRVEVNALIPLNPTREELSIAAYAFGQLPGLDVDVKANYCHNCHRAWMTFSERIFSLS